jgi:hypothetical protein
MNKITEKFPCLTNIFSKLDQRKIMAYLKYSDGGYYDCPDEMFLFDLWEDCHTKLDSTLDANITLWDRYIIHDQLDYLLFSNDLLFNVEMEGRYMFDFYQYPPEEDDHEDSLYNRLQKISPFENIQWIKKLKAGDIL